MGRQACLSFAKAGAARIVLLGRREESLTETASLVASSTSHVETLVRPSAITDLKVLQNIATEVGTRQVTVVASVHAPAVATLASTDIVEWWQGFEVCRNLRMAYVIVATLVYTFPDVLVAADSSTLLRPM